MERKFVYFLENEKGEWYYMVPEALDMHFTSSNRNMQCCCWHCRNPFTPASGFTNDPLKAWALDKREVGEQILELSKTPELKGCKVTEHEFVGTNKKI